MTTPTKESVSDCPAPIPRPDPPLVQNVKKRMRVAFVEDDDDYRETVSAEQADHGYDEPLHQPGNE